jgi:hypothetical protein
VSVCSRVLPWEVNHKKKSLRKCFDITYLVENFMLIILVKKLSLFHQQMTVLGWKYKNVKWLKFCDFFQYWDPITVIHWRKKTKFLYQNDQRENLYQMGYVKKNFKSWSVKCRVTWTSPSIFAWQQLILSYA